MKLKSGILFAALSTSAAFVACSDISNAFVASFATQSGVAYEVPIGTQNSFLPITGEYGNQIILAGSDRGLTAFSFGYSSDYSAVGGINVAFYADDPLTGLPGERLYHNTTPIDLDAGVHLGTISFDPLMAIVPTKFTFTVSFSGNDSSHHAGLLLPDLAPTVGSLAYNDYLVSATPGAPFVGERAAVVPEPSTYALAGVAGLAWLAFAGYRRCRQ